MSENTIVYVCPSRHHNYTREEGLTQHDIIWYFGEEDLGTVVRATRLSADEGESRAGNCKSLLKYEDMWEVECICNPREQGSIYSIPYSLQLPSDRRSCTISILDSTAVEQIKAEY